MTSSWRARWAWGGGPTGDGLTARYFRRSFFLKTVPRRLMARISADSRYRLWVNGRPVGRGPLKGEPAHYFFETYDLGPYLKRGRNTLAAEVRWYGKDSPASVVSTIRPGFLFEAEGREDLDTPGKWEVLDPGAVGADTESRISNAMSFLGHTEIVDGRKLPRGWPGPGSRHGWKKALDCGPVGGARPWGANGPRDLFPREVPHLVEEPRRFVRTIREMRPVEHLFASGPRGWKLRPGEGGEVVLDAGALTTGYPELLFEGGAGRRIEVTYGEAVVKPGRNPWENRVKGVRDDLSAGVVDGYRDTLKLPGGRFRWEPFHWRTFWFVKVRVLPGPSPMRLADFTYRWTSYPQSLKARFESSDPDTDRFLDVSWRTLQNCAHETYEDCPYYEQLNYVADTRLQALCSMALAGEGALARRSIRLYRDSLRPDGLVHSRVPCTEPQLIPYFALVWVLMAEDYWQWAGPRERDFLRSCLYAVDGVLGYFRGRLKADGFVGKVPDWNMVDSCEGWPNGAPPALLAGNSTYLTALYAMALESGARLHREAGNPSDARRWEVLRPGIVAAVRKRAWSAQEGLFLEGAGRARDRLSQHSQVAAILSGAASPGQARSILGRLTTDPGLHRMKFMQSYYLARALEKAGAYGEFWTHVLSPWRDMLAKRLSTWAEYPDPSRSDCHAWSAWIAADFVTTVLGVNPGKPGFAEVLIRPQVGGIEWARGEAPTPHGPVRVEWRKSGGGLEFETRVPRGIPARIVLPGRAPVRLTRGGYFRSALRRP